VKSDLVAMGLSAVCLVHCLLLPVAVAAVPVWHTWLGNSEAGVHWVLLGIGIVVTVWALAAGFRRHGAALVLVIGALGLTSMLMAATHGFERPIEILLTLTGAAILGIAHVLNLRFCARCSHPS